MDGTSWVHTSFSLLVNVCPHTSYKCFPETSFIINCIESVANMPRSMTKVLLVVFLVKIPLGSKFDNPAFPRSKFSFIDPYISTRSPISGLYVPQLLNSSLWLVRMTETRLCVTCARCIWTLVGELIGHSSPCSISGLSSVFPSALSGFNLFRLRSPIMTINWCWSIT